MPLASGFPPTSAEWTFLVVVLVILVGPLLAERLRLPGMIGLLLGGMVVGPTVLGWVEREGAVDGIGTIGLLLLMFMAGLELDLDDFRKNRANAVRFGGLTFGIPIVLGAVIGAAVFDYGWGAAVLFGSLWASHTLVAYPIARERGLSSDRGVSMAVGGTVITDTLALSSSPSSSGRTRAGAASRWSDRSSAAWPCSSRSRWWCCRARCAGSSGDRARRATCASRPCCAPSRPAP